MKRSEMVERIQTLIAFNMHNMPLDKLATGLLYCLEQMGMSPPGYMKPIPLDADGKQHPLVPGDFQNEAGVWCTPGQREWELE